MNNPLQIETNTPERSWKALDNAEATHTDRLASEAKKAEDARMSAAVKAGLERKASWETTSKSWFNGNSGGRGTMVFDPANIDVEVQGVQMPADQAKEALSKGWISRSVYDDAVLAAARRRDPSFVLPPNWNLDALGKS